MRIGIIGAGAIGTILARKFRASGHEVLLANSRGKDSVLPVAGEIGVTPVSAHDALREVDAVVVSIPEERIPELRPVFDTVPDELVIIETGNYYPRVRDREIADIEAGLPESKWVERQLGRSVIKAFNSILAQSLADCGTGAGDPTRIALPVAGDDPHSKRIAIRLVDDAGFDAVDAGSLAESWRQQPGMPAYCTDLAVAGLRRALAADCVRHLAPQRRDLAIQRMIELGFDLTNQKWVELNREIFGITAG